MKDEQQQTNTTTPTPITEEDHNKKKNDIIAKRSVNYNLLCTYRSLYLKHKC